MLAFLSSDGEMGDRLRAHDWSQSPLGLPAQWPLSLRTAVNIMISAKQPMFLVWGPDLTFLYNDAYTPLLGGRHPDALARPFQEIWADIWDEIEPLVNRALAGEATWIENLGLHMQRNGYPEQAWFTFSYSPLRDDQGDIAGMFCACNETTRYVLAERRNMAERERLYELTRDLFAVATFDGYLSSINPAWLRVLGRSEAEILDRPYTEIIHPDDVATATDVVAVLQRGEPVHQFQIRLLKADGEPVAFAWSAVPDAAPGSGIFYAVGRDITEELQRNEQRRQSQKLEAVGQLTGGIAHDFNNLLQAVQGCLDLIEARPHDGERVRRLAEHGLAATERGTRLTTQLLAFSRAQKLEMRATDVRALIAGMADLLQRSIGPQITIRFNFADSDFTALCDPTQLEMALLNLAINARDVMPDGGELIISASVRTIYSDIELAPGPHLEIRVTDTGAGMSADVAARAFDPFFSTKGVGKGTGLGLSQVYGMARQAGGTARIVASGPRGTSIALLLKMADPIADLAPGIALVPQISSDASRRSILVIDDDADVRRFLQDSLETMGFQVTFAEDGEQGLAVLGELQPDLLLLDFAMPGMNGAEVAQRARAICPALPIVFATGFADTAAIEAVIGAPANILKKPFRVAELASALHAALQ